jgi:hypothetical protein
MPTWLNGKQIVLTKTQNGWSVGPEKNTLPEQCVVFETFAALTYWLDANWGNPAP